MTTDARNAGGKSLQISKKTWHIRRGKVCQVQVIPVGHRPFPCHRYSSIGLFIFDHGGVELGRQCSGWLCRGPHVGRKASEFGSDRP